MFHVPTKIHYGAGSIQDIRDYNLTSLCVIADPFLLENEVFQDAIKMIEDEGISYEIFSDIVPDAPLEKVVEGVTRLEENEHQAILAIGGGSTLDTAKAIGFFHGVIYKKPEKVMVFAVPTTSGTGSEVTSYVVIKDTKTGVKYPIRDEKLAPDVAILDTNFVMSMPPKITVDTGFDALTHAMEAYVSKNANHFTDVLARDAVKNVCTWLPKVLDMEDPEYARERLHVAACTAGIAFDQAGVGINHSLAHIVGARFGIPHGRANAILLPYVTAYNFNHMKEKKYLDLAEMFGAQGFSEEIKFRNMLKALIRARNKLGVPHSFRDAGVDEEEFKKQLEELAKIAYKDGCTSTNPVLPEISDLEMILCNAYYGDDPLQAPKKFRTSHTVIGRPSPGII